MSEPGMTGKRLARFGPRCLAEEWQRDGRGLWAMRACQYYAGHTGGPHAFGPWKYNVQPPQASAQPASVDAVDPHASDPGTPTPRA